MKSMKLKNAIGIGLLAHVAVIAIPVHAQDVQTTPMQNESPMTSTKSLGLTQNAWNSYLRNRGESKLRPGYIRYEYDPRSSYPIRTREGMITTIKLPEGEKLSQAFAGDEIGFQVALATETSIVIKAAYPGVDTNIVAYGEDGRIYTFYVRSESIQSKEISDFLIEIVRLEDGASNGSESNSHSTPLSDASNVNSNSVENASIGYGFATLEKSADAPYKNPSMVARNVRDPYATQLASLNPKYREYAEWTDFNPNTIVEDLGVYVDNKIPGGTIPYRVFRDNRFTYIDYGPNASQMTEWPTPQIVIQGVEGPVGNRTSGPGGRMIVLEALGEFVLRNGQRAIIIKPRSTYTAENLREYPVSSQGLMQIPRDLPPGQESPIEGQPVTIKPVQGSAITINGEAQSEIVSIPDPKSEKIKRKRLKNPKKEKIITETVSKTVTPVARGNGYPIETVTATREVIIGTTGVTNANEMQKIQAVPQIPPQAPIIGSYYVSLSAGSKAQLEEKWKSFKVQYYNELLGKKPEYISSGENYELHIGPLRDANEGINLCSIFVSETDCSVKTVR